MGIKRYTAEQDSTITNAFKTDLTTRATSSNMGEADVTEIFSIYAQATTSSIEKSRALYQFPITSISADRTSGDIPISGSVEFYLRLYNAKHGLSLPRRATYVIQPVSQSWVEGDGLDMESYLDSGSCSWKMRNSANAWTTAGGSFLDRNTNTGIVFDKTLGRGTEDLEINISGLVEKWIDGTYNNYGVVVRLSGTFEDGTNKRSYYTKKFFARGTEFFFKKPTIEARWDSSIKDNTGNFVLSSSLLPAGDNLNTLYLYNFFRGQLRDIPANDVLKSTKTDQPQVRLALFSASGPTGHKITLPKGGGVATSGHEHVTGSRVSTGIYSASFAYTSSHTKIYPVWYTSPEDTAYTQLVTGPAVTVNTHTSLPYDYNTKFISKITNLKPVYSTDETARFRLFARQKNFTPNVYTKAQAEPQNHIIDNAYFKITRISDKLSVIPFGTASTGPSDINNTTGYGTATDYTRLSYDVSGNYFDLDMSLLEPGYLYSAGLAYYLNGQYREQKEKFNFRVEVDE
tara:strand:+ start:6644 stop:8188 length:1545 start_codon:yes stop_codon:yes gene_type:complete